MVFNLDSFSVGVEELDYALQDIKALRRFDERKKWASNLKIGDKVRVRSVGSMEKEFGSRHDGSIRVRHGWNKAGMEPFIGTIIKVGDGIPEDALGRIEEGTIAILSGYYFSKDMVEPL